MANPTRGKGWDILAVVLIVLVALPGSFLLTVALFPFLAWVESETGIETIGHSGPADWCILTLWGLCAGIGIAFYRRCRRREKL